MGYTTIIPRRGTASEWSEANPVLWEGELGFVKPDEDAPKKIWKFKIGDGRTAWNSLPWAHMNSIVDLGEITVSSSSFAETEDDHPDEYIYRATITDSRITESSVLEFMLSQDSYSIMRLSNEYLCFDGGCYIYTDAIPSSDVVFNNIQIRETNNSEVLE